MSGGALDAIRARRPQRGWGLVALLIIVVTGAGIAWAAVAELDEVAVATGEVVPQGATRVVQHLEGGIVRELLVSEGDTVKAGDELLRLDLGTQGVNIAELAVRRDGLALRRARLVAEAEGKALDFPDDLASRRPSLAQAERDDYDARRRKLDSARKVLAEQIEQRTRQIDELRARNEALKADLLLAAEKLMISQDLVRDGLTSRLDHLEARRDVGRLEGERRTVTAQIETAKSARAEAEARLADLEERVRSEVRSELAPVEVELRRIDEVMAEAARQKGRTTIRSPIDGTVKKLRYNTIGGVVRPGDAILEIVPERDRLVIEARLDPADRGYVRAGQPAIVKITTYDYIRYGGLEGRVVRISPDSDATADGRTYFRVVVETGRTWLGDTAGSLPISPGMQATVDIKTGRRTVADYVLRPVLKLRSEAFRER